MKSRKVIQRKACLALESLQSNCLYQVVKCTDKLLQDGDYWRGALVWKRDNEENIEGIGLMAPGFTGVLNGILYPRIRFDSSFKFMEILTRDVEATRCRTKLIKYVKNFKKELDKP